VKEAAGTPCCVSEEGLIADLSCNSGTNRSLFLIYAVLPMLALVPLSVFLMRRFDARLVLVIGLVAFATAGLLGTQVTHDWSLGDRWGSRSR
jgi:hypothetical protein